MTVDVTTDQQRMAEQKGLESLTRKLFEFFLYNQASIPMARAACRVYLLMPELEGKPNTVELMSEALQKIWEEEKHAPPSVG